MVGQLGEDAGGRGRALEEQVVGPDARGTGSKGGEGELER